MTESTTTQAAVDVRGLTKTFGSVTALKGATLSARSGEITAIVGDNGAGKSTLIKCLAGVHVPDSGETRLGGEVVTYRSPEDARRHGIETVFQDLALSDELTVWQNMFINRELTWGMGPVRLLNRTAMKVRAQETIERLLVSMPSVNRTVKRLSGGQRQAVAIARAVLWGHRVIIMDEPTAALGLRETAQVEELIQRVVDDGTTIILISHNFDQVARLSSQVWVMRAGTVVGGARTAEVTREEIVAMVTGAAS